MATTSCIRGSVASKHWVQEGTTLSCSETKIQQLSLRRLSSPHLSLRSGKDAVRHGRNRYGRGNRPGNKSLSSRWASSQQHDMRASCSMDNSRSDDSCSVSPIASSSENNRRVARIRFIEEVGPGRPDEDIDLAKAALLLSAEDEAMAYIERERDLAAVRREGRNPPVMPSPVKTQSDDPDANGLPLGGATLAKWLSRLSLLALEVETLLKKQSGDGAHPPRYPLKVLKAVNAVLYEAQGYRGMSRPGDPRNSHLHLVLQRGIGSPALLSIVYMEVCKRLDVRMAGTPLDEDYFMTWPMADGMQMIFDAFHSGQSFFWSDVKDLYLRFLPRGAAWEESESESESEDVTKPAAETSGRNSSTAPLNDVINFPNLPGLNLQPFASAGAGQSSAMIGAQLTPAMSTAGKASRAGQEFGNAATARGMREGRPAGQEGMVIPLWEGGFAQEAEGSSSRLLPILKSSGGGDHDDLQEGRSGVPVRPASNREILACVVKTLRNIHWTRATRSLPSLSLRAPLLPTPPDNVSANQSHLELSKSLRPQDTILALSASERLVILFPNDWEVRREHGVILYHTGHYEYAVQELSAAMTLAPSGMEDVAIIQSLVDRIGLLMQELRWQQEDRELGSGLSPL